MISAELVVYTWFLPLFVYLAIPAVIVNIRFVVYMLTDGGIKKSKVALQLQDNVTCHEKRQQSRFAVEGALADVSDGTSSCSGVVCNISKFGIGLMGLPEKFVEKAGNLSIIVKGQGNHYPMYLTPQWKRKEGPDLQTGGVLGNVPSGWEDFVRSGFASE